MLMIFPADISPLSFSPVGEMQFTLRSVKDLWAKMGTVRAPLG